MPKTKKKKKKGISRRQPVSWNERLVQLKEYKQQNGNCNVSTHDENNKQLANWVSHQRQAYKNGNLSDDRIELLNGIGFEWVSSKVVSWDERFEQLEAYKQVNGNCNVSTRDEDNKQLGEWVTYQRQSYKKGNLSSDQIKLLNSIGFNWNPVEDRWNEMFRQLEGYKKDHGDCDVPWRYKVNPQLATWVHTQRTAFKNGKLSPYSNSERFYRLQGIGFKCVLGQGYRATVAVSDVEEEDSSSSEEEEDEDDGTTTLKSTTATQRRSRLKTGGKKKAVKAKKAKPARSTSRRGSSKSKEDKDEEAEEDSTLDNDEEAEDEGEDEGHGGDGSSSFVVDEGNDNNDQQNRNVLAATVTENSTQVNGGNGNAVDLAGEDSESVVDLSDEIQEIGDKDCNKTTTPTQTKESTNNSTTTPEDTKDNALTLCTTRSNGSNRNTARKCVSFSRRRKLKRKSVTDIQTEEFDDGNVRVTSRKRTVSVQEVVTVKEYVPKCHRKRKSRGKRFQHNDSLASLV